MAWPLEMRHTVLIWGEVRTHLGHAVLFWRKLAGSAARYDVFTEERENEAMSCQVRSSSNRRVAEGGELGNANWKDPFFHHPSGLPSNSGNSGNSGFIPFLIP